MTQQAIPPDPAESDLYWSGYSGYATLPTAGIGAILSTIVMLGIPPLGGWLRLQEHWVAFACFWLVLLGWIALSLVWVYRAASYVYRLTPNRLYLDFGNLFKPTPALDLTHVTAVESQADRLGKLFGVGSVIVHSTERAPTALRGIYRPRLFADAIRQACADKATTCSINPAAT